MNKIVGGFIPPKEHKKLKTEDAVERILSRLLFAKMEDVKNARDDCLFRPEQMGPMWMESPNDDLDISFFDGGEINSPEIVWPVSIGMVGNTRSDVIHCTYIETADPKRMRGKYRVVGRKNLALYTCRIERAEMLSAVEYASWVGSRWISSGRIRYDDALWRAARDVETGPLQPFRQKFADEDSSVGELCALGQSMALTYRYVWGAQFSIPGSARVIIPCEPSGILELFRDRDKPADLDRRAPLRHWVRQHLRRKGEQRDFTKVREHLRGNERFNWRGFDVVIRPSAFDMERNRPKT